MALVPKRGLLNVSSMCLQSKRFRGKINLRRPQQPNHERATFFAVAKPLYEPRPKAIACDKDVNLFDKTAVENKLEKIYARELYQKFAASQMIVFYHLNPTTADRQYKAFAAFHKANMLIENHGKTTMELALGGTKFEPVLEFYTFHNMILFSPERDIKKMLKVSKKFPHLTLLAGILDGRFVSKDELIKYSNIPSIEMARAELVQTLQAAGSDVVQKLNVHQQTLVSHLEERMKQLKTD